MTGLLFRRHCRQGSGAQLLRLLLDGGELHRYVLGLMGEELLRILRVNELLGEIECWVHIRIGEADCPRADVLGARLQAVRVPSA